MQWSQWTFELWAGLVIGAQLFGLGLIRRGRTVPALARVGVAGRRAPRPEAGRGDANR